MQLYQERVIQEKRELDTKLEKLRAFISSNAFLELHHIDRERLERQEKSMVMYSDVLGERISGFNHS